MFRRPNKTYSIIYNFTTWKHSTSHFVWITNEKSELYLNNKLIGAYEAREVSQNKPILEQEYILLHGNYNYSSNASITETIQIFYQH